MFSPPGAIVADLDRTLTDKRLHVVPSARNALRDLRRRGVRTLLATGRSVPELRRRPWIRNAFDALIVETGSLVLTPDRLDAVQRLPKEAAQAIAWLEARKIRVRVGTTAFSIDRRDARHLLRYPGRARLALHPNRDRLDVTRRGVSKATGLRHGLTLAGGRRTRPVWAFGDGENDVDLFEAADLAIAVRNAVPSLRRKADVVTREYGGWGVAAFLRRHALEVKHR